MTRIVLRISVCILLGLVTTIVIAWACAWRLDRHIRRALAPPNTAGMPVRNVFGVQTEFLVWWSGDAIDCFGATQLYELYESYADDPGGYALEDYGQPPSWSLPHPKNQAERTQTVAGAPFRAMRSVRDEQGAVSAAIVIAGVELPYHPIWPGLLANTAIYAGAWWVILFGPGMFIRARRRRAGRCMKCGYDLRAIESSACPECGTHT